MSSSSRAGEAPILAMGAAERKRAAGTAARRDDPQMPQAAVAMAYNVLNRSRGPGGETDETDKTAARRGREMVLWTGVDAFA